MRPGADGNRSVTKACDLDKVRQEALKTLISKSSLDAEALERHLRHCVFKRHVEVSVGHEAALQSFWCGRVVRSGQVIKVYRDTRSVQAAHSEV